MAAAAQTPFAYRQKTHEIGDLEGMTRAMHEEGFVLIPGVLSSDEVASLRAAIDRLQPFGSDWKGMNEHYKCVFNRDPAFWGFIDRPGITELAEATMGDQCHLIGMTGWKSHPGHNGWGPHTDHTLVTVPEEIASKPEAFPIYICTAHYYTDELDEEFCPTWVIGGTHKSGRSLSMGRDGQPEWHGKKLEPVVCRPGDVLFFRSEIWHTGSENRTNKTRYLLQVHYGHRTMAQRFAPWPFIFNQELLATADERRLRLLGKHPEMAYG